MSDDFEEDDFSEDELEPYSVDAQYYEISIRDWACVKLRVPMSKDQELNEIIRESRRLDSSRGGSPFQKPGRDARN